jgi:predicted metal-dependent phosphoesterase TrpH
MTMEFIDIHSHTDHSDGTSTVTNSLTRAEEEKLFLFSVTDHNTVDAYEEIAKKRELFSGRILPGVELSTMYLGESIEVLGYGIDVIKMAKLISENYYTYREKQGREARLDTEAVLGYGVVLDDWFVEAMYNHPETVFDPGKKTNRPYLLAEMKKHPENAKFFKSEEEFFSLDRHRFARDYLFNPKSTLYSDLSSLCPTLDKAIDIIHECGGLAFLAHAFVYSKDFIDKLPELISYGFDGMECCYGTFTAEQKKYMSDFCDANGLYKSGGSDFHGLDMRPMNHMGLSCGEKIPFSLIEPWLDKVKDSLI